MPSIIEKPQVNISPSILKDLKTYTSDFGQVTIHGICKTKNDSTFIRIWPTTYLYDVHSPHVSELVHFEKISGFPVWTEVKAHSQFGFTLIFSGLPSSCTLFDLKEIIPQSNGFHIPAIKRNELDVYYIDFSD